MKNKTILRILLILSGGLFFYSNLHAQQILHLKGTEASKRIKGSSYIRIKDQRISFVQFSEKKMATTDMSEWLVEVLNPGENSRFVKTSEQKDHLGFIHQEYQQYYGNIPVEYGMYKVHITNNQVEKINGELYTGIHVPIQPQIDPQQSIDKALENLDASVYLWEIPEQEKHLKWREGSLKATYYPQPELVIYPLGSKYHLCYKMDIYTHEPLGRYWMYIDAITGEVLGKVPRIHHANTPGSAQTLYSGIRSIISNSAAGGMYLLQDYSRGNGISTIDSETMAPFKYNQPNWDGGFPNDQRQALDTHWGGEMTHDYFLQKYGRNGIDNLGYFMEYIVMRNTQYPNAFWDGDRITIGDGNYWFINKPLAAISIIGHEYTHGLTEKTAHLVYNGEPGFLNESFSDILGVCIDYYTRGGDLNNPLFWTVGYEVTADSQGFRSISNPNVHYNPDTYKGDYWNPYAGAVHENSGVQNHWFYLLAMGGTGTNDIWNDYSVNGIGMNDAADIAYRNLTVYLGPNSDYEDSRFYSVQAAIDLFGNCSPQHRSVENAWYAVGIGTRFDSIVTADFHYMESSGCDSLVPVVFTNSSGNADEVVWYFGDGDSLVSHATQVQHAYVPGNYSVTLVASGIGCDGNTYTNSITRLITVAASTGNILLTHESTNMVAGCCSGNVFDNGGAGNYLNNTNAQTTIQVAMDKIIVLNFQNFNMANDPGDYLQINGQDLMYFHYNKYSAQSPPDLNTDMITKSNKIDLFMKTNGSINGSGFNIQWHCSPNTMTIVPTNNCQNSSVTFEPEFINEFTQITGGLWNMGDGTLLSGPMVYYQYTTPGTYTVTAQLWDIEGNEYNASLIYNYTGSPFNINPPGFSYTANGLEVQFYSDTVCSGCFPIWYFGDGGTSAFADPLHLYTEPGTYYVSRKMLYYSGSYSCEYTGSMYITIEENSNNTFTPLVVYPNPTSGMVNFSNNSHGPITEASLYTTTGNCIKTIMNPQDIDLTELATATYILRVKAGEFFFHFKVVKID